METKQEIQEMLFIIFCGILVSGVLLFYLQRKFVFSTLHSEVEKLEINKQNLLKKINNIKLQTAEHSSIRRIHKLLPKQVTVGKFVEQKVITLQIPPRPPAYTPSRVKDQIIQHDYLIKPGKDGNKGKQKGRVQNP